MRLDGGVSILCTTVHCKVLYVYILYMSALRFANSCKDKTSTLSSILVQVVN